MGYLNISILTGKILTDIDASGDEVIFTCNDGTKYKMYHEEDCCESVSLEDVNGDWEDIKNTPILLAEERTNSDDESLFKDRFYGTPESFTWTFYTIRTIKGTVDLRWLGESNGYYSESVYLIEL